CRKGGGVDHPPLATLPLGLAFGPRQGAAMTPSHFLPPLMLVGSHILMTWACYGHLKRPGWAMWLAILISWGIAFFEYCLAVPANRIGYGAYTGQQLKVMQEVITLGVCARLSVI